MLQSTVCALLLSNLAMSYVLYKHVIIILEQVCCFCRLDHTIPHCHNSTRINKHHLLYKVRLYSTRED